MKFDIVFAPFPFDDLSQKKVRPLLLLSNSIGYYNHVIAAFISSQTEKDYLPSDILIEYNSPEFDLTGLKKSSLIKLHRLVTIPEEIINFSIGKLPVSYQNEVIKKLIQLFEL